MACILYDMNKRMKGEETRFPFSSAGLSHGTVLILPEIVSCAVCFVTLLDIKRNPKR